METTATAVTTVSASKVSALAVTLAVIIFATEKRRSKEHAKAVFLKPNFEVWVEGQVGFTFPFLTADQKTDVTQTALTIANERGKWYQIYVREAAQKLGLWDENEEEYDADKHDIAEAVAVSEITDPRLVQIFAVAGPDLKAALMASSKGYTQAEASCMAGHGEQWLSKKFAKLRRKFGKKMAVYSDLPLFSGF